MLLPFPKILTAISNELATNPGEFTLRYNLDVVQFPYTPEVYVKREQRQGVDYIYISIDYNNPWVFSAILGNKPSYVTISTSIHSGLRFEGEVWETTKVPFQDNGGSVSRLKSLPPAYGGYRESAQFLNWVKHQLK